MQDKLIVLQNILKMTYDSNLTNTKINNKLKLAYNQRIQIKKMGETSLSLEYRTRLAMAKEEKGGGIKAATYVHNMTRIEVQRRLAMNIIRMKGKSGDRCTTQVITKNSDGEVTDYTSKEPMEKVIVIWNDKNIHQIEGGCQLLTPYLLQN